jgi:aromatic ring-opening dioxygenase LigB subunit
MPLVGISYFPHGAMVLDPSYHNLPHQAQLLHTACRNAARVMEESQPDTIILLTPHGLSLSNALGVYQNVTFGGNAGWLGYWEEFCVDCSNVEDRVTTQLLNYLKAHKIDCEGIAAFSKGCKGPLAWGEVVPLWFHKEYIEASNAKVLVLSVPQRRLSDLSSYKHDAHNTGEIVHQFINSHMISNRVHILVSGDLCHVHNNAPLLTEINFQRPAGLDPNPTIAKEVDSYLCSWAEIVFVSQEWNQSLLEQTHSLLFDSPEISDTRLAEGKLCGFAGICFIQGILQSIVKSDLRLTLKNGKVHAYAAPTYYGMLVASISLDINHSH